MFPSIESAILIVVGIVLLGAIIGLFKVGLGALFTKREKYNARREVVNILLKEITQRAVIYQNPAVVQTLNLWKSDLSNRLNAGRDLEDMLGASLDMHRSAVLKIQTAEHGQRMQQALNDHERINHMIRFDVSAHHHDRGWSVGGPNVSVMGTNLRSMIDEHRHLTLTTVAVQEERS
mgnify:CR=1 FL=1